MDAHHYLALSLALSNQGPRSTSISKLSCTSSEGSSRLHWMPFHTAVYVSHQRIRIILSLLSISLSFSYRSAKTITSPTQAYFVIEDSPVFVPRNRNNHTRENLNPQQPYLRRQLKIIRIYKRRPKKNKRESKRYRASR